MKRIVFRIIGLAIIILVVCISIFYFSSLQINLTNSYPLGIYKKYGNVNNISRGNMVLFCPPDTKIFKRAKKLGYLNFGVCPGNYIEMLKKVSGLPGDKIYINKFVYINGKKLKNSILYDEDSRGNVLPKIDGNITLKKDEYFLTSDYNNRSFDSRYFGAIKKEQIEAKVKKVIIF